MAAGTRTAQCAHRNLDLPAQKPGPGGNRRELRRLATHDQPRHLGGVVQRSARDRGVRPARVLDRLAREADAVLGNGTDGAEIVEWIVERAIAGLCAMELGVADKALRMAATRSAGVPGGLTSNRIRACSSRLTRW